MTIPSYGIVKRGLTRLSHYEIYLRFVRKLSEPVPDIFIGRLILEI
jgi:hypothetical protein